MGMINHETMIRPSQSCYTSVAIFVQLIGTSDTGFETCKEVAGPRGYVFSFYGFWNAFGFFLQQRGSCGQSHHFKEPPDNPPTGKCQVSTLTVTCNVKQLAQTFHVRERTQIIYVSMWMLVWLFMASFFLQEEAIVSVPSKTKSTRLQFGTLPNKCTSTHIVHWGTIMSVLSPAH